MKIKRTKHVLLLSILCISLFVLMTIDMSTNYKNTRQQCISYLSALDTNVPALLIDEHVLEHIENNKCRELKKPKIKIAVEEDNTEMVNDSRFEVIGLKSNETRDYLELDTNPRRIIPKSVATIQLGNLHIPTDIPQFLGFLKRSKFVECEGRDMKRVNVSVSMDGVPAAKSLAILRDLMLKYRMFPFLNGGTLLGWYRECGVIPHTNDMDLAVFREDFNPEIVDYFESNHSDFRLRRKLGMLNDSFEMTVSLKNGYQAVTDIFVMYTDRHDNGTIYNWVGGVDSDGTKYKFSYPKYDPWCSADLFGHIFWVTCTPKQMLTFEYGENWYRDHRNYIWYQSGNNVKPNGKWTKEQMKSVYVYY